MTENLKIEVSMVDVEGGLVDTSLATKEELTTAVQSKADLIEGKIPVAQLPNFDQINGVSEAINGVETKLRNEVATALGNSNNSLESRIDEKLVLKADLVNGRVPASQSPAFKDVEGAKGALDGLKEALTNKYDQKVLELSEGKADLVDGKIPTSQLPIDEIVTPLEFELKSQELDTKFSNLEDSVEAEKNAFITQAGNLIAGKANAVDVYDKVVVDNKLSGKVDKAVYESEIAKKADQKYVDVGLTAVVGGHKAYTTLALAQADTATLPTNTIVEVTNDGANNGAYQWNGTTLTKSAYDPLTQAKSYTDGFFTQYNTASLLTVLNTVLINGIVSTNTNFDTSDFIPVIGGESYNLYSYIAGTARHAWYDKDKVFISAFGDDQTALSLKTYIAPDNARYMRVTAYTTARTVAYLNSKSYVVNKIKTIIEQHMPNVDSSKIIYGSSDVNATLNRAISKQNTIIANQNSIVSQLDLMTDKESPYFVNTSQFVKAVLTPSNFDVVNVTARVSDTQMTVSDASAFIYSGSCVVYDPTANSYTSHNVIGINGTTITVMPPLPANPTQVQTMHDVANGQHLTLFGYKGLADHLLNSVQKYSYKKSENLVFNFNPTKYVKQTTNLGQITTDGTVVAIPVTLLGTAKTGGYVAGTTALQKWCDLLSSPLGIGNNAHTQYLSKAYNLTDTTAGNGFEISFNAQSSDGFIEIPLAVRDESYISSADSQTYKTSGRARLQVFNGATSIHDSVYAAGQVHHVFVDFTTAETIKVRVTCETSVPTCAHLSGIFAYKKSAKTSKESFFKDGDVIAFLGDSWTQFPIATTIGEQNQTRPDGSISTGSQWLSRRMKEKLQVQGKNVTMLNMGFGGQTSRWGKYWVNTIIALEPKPTHCVLCFYINDRNGIETPSLTAYDFDPSNMFVNKTVASGGVDGRVRTYDEWEANIEWLCEKLSANGIKPIVIMPSQTASASQAQVIRSGQLDRLADGFN